MEIYERIKLIRQKLGLSQAKFAQEVSISNGYIASIELGNRNVNDRIIRLICITFGVNEHWLRCGEGEIFAKDKPQNLQIASSLFCNLRPEFQEYIIKQIDELLLLQQKITSEQAERARIDAEVEAYRQELLAEQKGAERSAPSADTEKTKKQA